MRSNVSFKIIDSNSKIQLENALIDIVVQQLIRKEDSKSEYIDEKKETCK